MNVLVSLAAVLVLALIAAVGAGSAGLYFVFGVALPYVAIVLFLGGVIWKVLSWAKCPVPFRIPTTCGQQKSHPWIKNNNLENPHNMLGVIGRMALEVLFFRSLFRNTRASVTEDGKLAYADTKWLWLAAIAFHYSFLVVLIRHLRLFTEPVPAFVGTIESLDGFFQVGVPAVYITSLVLLAAVSYLLVRRLFIPQIRYISLVNDYFPLFLIIGIATTGIIMRHFVKTDLISVKALAIGLVTFKPAATEVLAKISPWFFVHFFFIMVLFAYFPFSKLMHAGGVFLSPTRNLANNSRFVRHINPWNPEVKFHSYEEYEDEFREKMVKVGIPVDKPLPAAPEQKEG